jgi:hypothetical protein
MTPIDWIDELHEKYKHLFETYEGEVTDKSYYQSGQVLRGIEVGEGWKRHVKVFLETLEWHTKHNRRDDKDNVIKIFQIKEKFGDCRCYVTAPELINDMVQQAVARLEGKCSLTCENCGATGNYNKEKDFVEQISLDNSNGWISCLCNKCLK